MPLPSWEQFLIGLYETLRVDDPRHPKRRKPVCRECEIVASAACFTASAYIMYYSRTGRFVQIPGFTMSIALACLGTSMLFSFPPEEGATVKSPLEKKLESLKKNEG